MFGANLRLGPKALLGGTFMYEEIMSEFEALKEKLSNTGRSL